MSKYMVCGFVCIYLGGDEVLRSVNKYFTMKNVIRGTASYFYRLAQVKH